MSVGLPAFTTITCFVDFATAQFVGVIEGPPPHPPPPNNRQNAYLNVGDKPKSEDAQNKKKNKNDTK